jgi:hypothetical protein
MAQKIVAKKFVWPKRWWCIDDTTVKSVDVQVRHTMPVKPDCVEDFYFRLAPHLERGVMQYAEMQFPGACYRELSVCFRNVQDAERFARAAVTDKDVTAAVMVKVNF